MEDWGEKNRHTIVRLLTQSIACMLEMLFQLRRGWRGGQPYGGWQWGIFCSVGTCHRSPHKKWQRRPWLTLSAGPCGFSIYWWVLVAGYYSTIGPMVLIEKGDVLVNLLFNVSGFGPQLSPQTKSISIHCEIRGPLPLHRKPQSSSSMRQT